MSDNENMGFAYNYAKDAPPTAAATSSTPQGRRMSDELLLRIMEATVTALSQTHSDTPAMEMTGGYNAALVTAKANHSDDLFLGALRPIEGGGFISAGMLVALYAQLRIVLESYRPGPDAPR